MLDSCASRTPEQFGPDWSHWPARSLGSGDPAVIRHHQGTHRTVSPEATWQAVQPLLGPAGITRIADITWLDEIGIPTVQVVRPASLTVSVSQGKASNYRAAQVSAVMESLEYWHGENAVPDLRFTATDDLISALTYDPAVLDRPPGSFYHSRTKLDWMIATTLLTGRRTWVPSAAVTVSVAVSESWGPPMFTMHTQGLASGNSYYEAALHGLYEIMERYCLGAAVADSTMWEVRADDVGGAECADLVDKVYRSGNELRIARLDLWSGYFCFAVELISPKLGVPFFGSGLHHDPKVALSRSITEAAQSRLTAISGVREDIPSTLFERFANVQPVAAQRSRTRFSAAPPTPWQVVSTDSLPELVAAAATAVVARTGIEPLAVVCDFPGACVPVVKVIAPGLLLPAAASPMRTPLHESV
ncbi:Ribosomal protein S12 methylthiotransferase accessory factor YcaO [Mycobacterium simulans]|uniref:Ribosomal protein S12 methylthiotransferase accessory factor YcaO n=1 Tax=Mycobacterium simulans TaxID=627089 RepID=A0A7Z7N9Y4_9MYCO|nr:YcaO-like family protein [Mycobacterium simulans]SOJ55266.1 Ribosomal protein S12 methylthiotransferase accessory factor YcaO [Mycobacterium simulans]